MGKTTYDSSTISVFPNGFKMVLPDGYRIDTEYDEDMNEVYHLRGGFYINDEGNEDFAFSGSFLTLNIDLKVNDDADPQTINNLRDPAHKDFAFNQVIEGVKGNLEEKYGTGKCLKLYNSSPVSTIMKYYQPISIFGATLDTYLLFYWVEVNENVVFGFTSVYRNNPDEAKNFHKHFLNVIKSVRVDEKPVDTGKLTPTKLEKALDLEANGDAEALDLGLSIGINVKNGDDETQYTINNDGSITEEKINAGLEYVTPDESLYPHYNSMLQTQGLGMFGINVVVNQTGTEYKFYNLAEDLNEDAEPELRNAVSQLKDTGAAKYRLADKAIKMRSLFHVSSGAFDPKHDKECELTESLMHRAYMMSALRSFAWTLTKYCEKLGKKPKDISLVQIQEIVDAVADANWLNYDDKSACKGLCGTQDLHVYYLPDKTPEKVKDAFRPSQETLDETKKMKENFPTYNPILSQIGSLDALRKDLEYIHPAIEKIYEDLKRSRNYDEPLESRDGDILYAWCALAYAARGPFFSEDGPVSCFFTQVSDSGIYQTELVTENKASEKKRADEQTSSFEETVIVDNCWAVTVPAGYIYCIDKKIIGGHRNIIIMEDIAGNDFKDPFCATVSFTSMFNESEAMPAPVMAKAMAGFMGNNINVLKDETDLYVAYYYSHSDNSDGEKLDIFKIDIGCGNGVSSIQVFFNNSKLSRREQHKLVERVAKSVRLSKPGEKNTKGVVIKDKKLKDETPSKTGSSITMWGFKTAEVPEKKIKLIDNEKGYPIRFLPRSEVVICHQNDMARFQYNCSHNYPNYNAKVDKLQTNADRFVTLYNDVTDADIKSGRLKNSAPIHALRSFVWTAVELIDDKDKTNFPTDAPAEMWQKLAEFIGSRGYANYKPSKKDDKRFGAVLLRNMEVRYIYDDICSWAPDDEYVNKALGRTMVNAERYSLPQLVDALLELMPIMELYFDQLKDPGLDQYAAECIKMIIKGWVAHAYAVKQPFYVVPGDKYAIDIDPNKVPNWCVEPNLCDYQDGMFTAYGTEIVQINNVIQEEAYQLPDGITGIVVTDKESFNKGFTRVKKLIYPRSFTGRIMVPSNVEEIEVLGDIDYLTLIDVSPDDMQPNLRSIIFKGTVKEVGWFAFSHYRKIKTLRLPEGLTRIGTWAFSQTELYELNLPESLTTIAEESFLRFPESAGTTINVYKTCPALSKIQKQLDALKKETEGNSWSGPYNIKLVIKDSPWATRAESFVRRLGGLYDNGNTPGITVADIKATIEETIGNYDNYIKCKEFICSEATGHGRTTLRDIVNSKTEDGQVYEQLPEILAKDINDSIESRNQEEKERKIAEINRLYQSDSITDLNRAITILEEMQDGGEEAGILLNNCSEKIENIKAAEYAEAEVLAAEGTEESINEALAKIRAISPYKDSTSRVIELTQLLEKERKYKAVASSMLSADTETLKDIKRKLDELGDYKDSKYRALQCAETIESIESEINEKTIKAQELVEAGDAQSLLKAEGIYSELKSIDKNQDNLFTYEKIITEIRELRSANIEIRRLNEEHAKLGFFKRKERLAIEDNIRALENRKNELEDSLNNMSEIEVDYPDEKGEDN